MALLVVTELSLFIVGSVITSGASNVSIPTDFGASRCFRLVTNLIVSESRNGVLTVEAAAELGFGSREYELIEVE